MKTKNYLKVSWSSLYEYSAHIFIGLLFLGLFYFFIWSETRYQLFSVIWNDIFN